jgi:hypothetical protein
MTKFFKKPGNNSVKPVDNSVKPAEFRVFKFFLFHSRLNFGRIFSVLTEFLKIRRIHHLLNFKEPPNFETLVSAPYMIMAPVFALHLLEQNRIPSCHFQLFKQMGL